MIRAGVMLLRSSAAGAKNDNAAGLWVSPDEKMLRCPCRFKHKSGLKAVYTSINTCISAWVLCCASRFRSIPLALTRI